MVKFATTAAVAALPLAMLAAVPAIAGGKDKDVQLAKCEQSFGTVAITDGDQQGWTQMKLASPRPMLATMIRQSGCFTLHDPASGKPADFLLFAVAGSKEEIDKSMDLAKGALTEGLVRSGAAGQVLSKVPMGGALFGMFGGLGGKKKTVMAGLRIMSPATGQTLIAGTGESRKSFIKIMGASDWAGSGDMGGYGASSDGKMLTGAFVEAFNGLVAQGSVLTAARPAPQAAATAAITVAVDTQLWPGPSKAGTPVRALRASTTLTPTGARNGLFVEVADNYGSKGWVSIEDLR
jgi:hypothetical protein